MSHTKELENAEFLKFFKDWERDHHELMTDHWNIKIKEE